MQRRQKNKSVYVTATCAGNGAEALSTVLTVVLRSPLKGKMPLPASRRLRGLTEAFVTAAVPIYFISTSGEYFVPAGLFDGDNFSMGTEIFVDEKGPYYELHPTSRKMTGAEVMAAFQQGGDNEK